MVHPLVCIATMLFGSSTALAIPFPFERRAGEPTPVSASDFGQFDTFTFFASAAYCPADKTKNWSCGANCDANPNFKPTASGGDGSDVQFWFVGFDSDKDAVIVAHQGTDRHKIQPLLTDAEFIREKLDEDLFPGISSDIRVHSGFSSEHAKTAQDVLAAAQQTMQDNGTNSIICVGHSLGAALSVLDAIFFQIHISGANIEIINYGSPRVGNQAFADFVDANLKITRITSRTLNMDRQDIVTVIPPRSTGFKHSSGEIHVKDDESFFACPGQDNDNSLCATGDASNIFEVSVEDHFGPYGNITLDSHCRP